MFTINIPRQPLWSRLLSRQARKKPKIIALFAYRYDEHLIPDLLENIRPFTDGWIAWDDTKRTDLWYNEGQIRRSLIEQARSSGADWVLAVDPDERYEQSLSVRISEMISGDRFNLWGFRFREMYAPDQYRVDGVWGDKVRFNLFALNPGQTFMDMHVHCPWCPTNPEYKHVLTDLNLYHLKMIDPQARKDRADLYDKVDVSGLQTLGYDYLADETGIILENIPDGKGYSPYREKPLKLVQYRK